MSNPNPIKLSTFTANFAETKQFKAVIDPPPEIGYPVKISVYSPNTIQIINPYGAVTGSTIGIESRKKEVINISALPEFPVKQVLSRRAANPIVFYDAKTVCLDKNQPIDDDFNSAGVDLIGSVEWIYLTFAPQIFTLSSLNSAGEYIVWARDENGCEHEIKFSLSEKTVAKNYQITLEAHDRTLAINKYAIRCMPYDFNITLKSSTGLLEETQGEQILIRESVSFNASDEQAASHHIDSLISSGADFFVDENYNFATSAVFVSDGKLCLSRKLTGVVAIEYLTSARLFNYTPQKIGNKTNYGVIIAFNKQEKQYTSFNVPLPSGEIFDKKVVARVYRELLVADKRYEMPTTLSPTISYANYPSANVSELSPESPKVEQNQAEISWNGVFASVNDFHELYDWQYPTAQGSHFKDIAWKISVEMPTDIEPNDISLINQKIAEVKAKYGII